jgi:Domain of unknown function (DUF397)
MAEAQWRKSSYSSGSGGNCVEVATNVPGVVAVRDSKDPDGPGLALSRESWDMLTSVIKSGALDRSFI